MNILTIRITKRYAKQQNGGVIVFIALFMIVLLGLFALAIDTNMLNSSREQTEHYARFAALTAIEKFHTTQWCKNGQETNISDPDRTACTNCEKYYIALSRVNSLLEANRIVGDKNVVPNIVTADNIDPACSNSDTSSDGISAQLIPGFMTNETTDCGTQRTPCFKPLDILNNDSVKPSAFKVEGSQFRQANAQGALQGISAWFARNIYGADNINIYSKAVATLIPRQGCFLVDISASSTRDTHLSLYASYTAYNHWIASGYAADGGRAYAQGTTKPHEYIPVSAPGQGWGNDFAYYLKCPDPSETNLNNPTLPYENCRSHPDPLPPGLNPLGYTNWTNHDRTWNFLKHFHPDRSLAPPGATPFSIHHYTSDYVIKKTYGDDHYNPDIHRLHPDPNILPDNEKFTTGSIDGSWFNMDMAFLNQNIPGYNGPEPLRSIFAGISTAMGRFLERQVAGDRACVIFYDRSVTWPRMFKLTSDFNGIRRSLNFSDINPSTLGRYNDPIESDPADIDIHPITDSQGILKIIRHGLFPRDNSNSYTNTILALALAYTELANAAIDSPLQTSDFIATIGDGMINCQTCQGSRVFQGSTNLPGACVPNTCANKYEFYKQAINDLGKIIPNNPSNIPIHVLLLGSAVAPHSLDIPDPNSPINCLTDKEYRKLGVSNLPVRGNPPSNSLPYWRNLFENASASTPFYQANEGWYKMAWYTQGYWFPIRPVQANCNISNTIFDQDGTPCDSRHFINGGQRRIFDPYCRTQEQQIIDAIDEILGDNPFILVEP